MTGITGQIQDATQTGVAGTLTITPDTTLVYPASPNAFTTIKPVVLTLDGSNYGTFFVNLNESQTLGITYHFVFQATTNTQNFFFPDGTTYTGPRFFDNYDYQWYTGTYRTSGSVQLVEQDSVTTTTLFDFHAIVPNVASIGFAQLIPTGITTDVLDTSLKRLADLLTSTGVYVQALRGGPSFKGAYNSATFYAQNDAVSYGGASWINISATPISGQTPSYNSTVWMLLADRGAAIGGTSGNDTAYDATGWDGAVDAPSRNAVRDIIVQLAKLANPTFTGVPAAPTAAQGTSTTQIATTAFVGNEITNRFTNAALGATATGNTAPTADNSTLQATTAFVKNALGRYSKLSYVVSSGTGGGSSSSGTNTRPLNTTDTNAGDVVNLTGNTFTLRTGTYIIHVSVAAYGAGLTRAYLWNNTSSTRTILGPNYNLGTTGSAALYVGGQFAVSGNTDFQIRQYLSNAIATNGLGFPSSESSINEVYAVVELWRID